ncbi:MAG: protein kinase [Gemmatimonadota bacterium]
MTTEPRLCPNCHTPLPAEAHFCLNCGTPTPTEPGVPSRTIPTGAFEVSRVRSALADRYRIERVLGEGGMATVYLAEDLKHHRQVAVKVMRPELSETLGAERFLREVEIAARMNHQNILPVHDSGAADGILYYVMPVVEGESLPARLKREKQLPVGEALRLGREVAEALAYAHKRGIIHRDIKPANILLHEGHALVADFGIARATSDAGALTKTGLSIGTPAYMSPEQASGDSNLDGRTDIYALGCVLYEMLAGEPPFTGPTAQAIITRSITEAPRPLTRTRSAIPAAVDAVVLRALAKSPADRHATATELANALTDAEDQSRTMSGASAPTRTHRFGGWQIATAAAVLVALAAIGWKKFAGGSAAGGDAARRVAVLPFENQGAESDAYLADGIVDELRDRLARLGKFTVIASTSADKYRGSAKSATEIASELHVDRVLMGKVRWVTGANGVRQVKVTTELVDGSSGDVTWRESFDGDLTDPLAIQGRIATRVAGALGAVLNQAQTGSLAGRPTTNAEAYNAYLQGRAGSGVSSAAQMRSAAEFYERAVALDSNFAAAWSRLAVALSVLYNAGTRDPLTARRAKEALDHALRLAPDSGYTHRVAAVYQSAVARDQVAARRETELALRLDPRDPRSLAGSASFDLADGNFRQGFEKLSRAREIDPLDMAVLNNLVRAQTYLGQYREAVATGDELMAMKPTDYAMMENVVRAYLANGDLPGARGVVQEVLKRVPATELVSYFAGYQELAFVLEKKDRDLLFRLTPAAFDNDRAWWGQSLATAAFQQGDMRRARAYADSSLVVARQQIEASPKDAQLRMINAVMLAYLGRTPEALSEAEHAISDTVGGSSDETNYALQQSIRVHLTLGEKDRALDQLEVLTKRQYYATPGFLKADPLFRSLDKNPRFERLANRGISLPVD